MRMQPFPPDKPYAVWALYTIPAGSEEPLTYYGRVLLNSFTELWRCEHRHTSRDEAQQCADAEKQTHV